MDGAFNQINRSYKEGDIEKGEYYTYLEHLLSMGLSDNRKESIVKQIIQDAEESMYNLIPTLLEGTNLSQASLSNLLSDSVIDKELGEYIVSGLSDIPQHNMESFVSSLMYSLAPGDGSRVLLGAMKAYHGQLFSELVEIVKKYSSSPIALELQEELNRIYQGY